MELMTLFLSLFSGLAALVLTLVVAQDIGSQVAEHTGDSARRAERLQRLRTFAESHPGDVVAWDRYGDSCRENDLPEDAINAWRHASSQSEPVANGVDWDHKIAMAQRDIEDRERPDRSWGGRFTGREQVCRTCGFLAPPGVSDCPHCGSLIPVESISEFWRHPLWKRVFRDDVVGLAMRIGFGVVAIVGAGWVPWEIRGVLLVALLFVLPFWWLRRFGQGG